MEDRFMKRLGAVLTSAFMVAGIGVGSANASSVRSTPQLLQSHDTSAHPCDDPALYHPNTEITPQDQFTCLSAYQQWQEEIRAHDALMRSLNVHACQNNQIRSDLGFCLER